MLTGSSETIKQTLCKQTQDPTKTFNIPPKRQGFKLYEWRNIEILSPSLHDFPSLTLSPVTPLNEDAFDKFSSSPAIVEKGFYLHLSTLRESEPQLLSLFLLPSPRVSSNFSS
ncbi:hypothetical protein UlMin_021090 [Ulmus minor]